MSRQRPLALLALIGAGLLAQAGCDYPPAAPVAPNTVQSLPFTDIAEEAGVRFVHDMGASGSHYMPETVGPGCMFFDYNGDGWADIYLIQGAALPGFEITGPLVNRLFVNERNGRFSEVPDAAGLADAGYGMGCCAADIDNDGDLDVLVTNFGPNTLYRNDGGRFQAVAAGMLDNRWSASAAFGDFDDDGFVDLYVANYVDYVPGVSADCRSANGESGYCPPEAFAPLPDRLYRNQGNGTFVDVSQKSGISAVVGRSLGVQFVDYDQDGWLDIFVACDQSPNILWRNRGDGTFENVAAQIGVALGQGGRVHNGMGVDTGDPDHDGDFDGIVTNFSGQQNSYFSNLGSPGFLLASPEIGLGLPSTNYVGFGCNFLDFDGDTWEDLFVANGHVNDHIESMVPNVTFPEPNQLFRNLGDGRFEEVSPVVGKGIWRKRVSRGSAIADFDHDGDIDLLVTNCNGPAALYRNEADLGNRWLTIRLEGEQSNRDGIGAIIRVTTEATTQTREVHAGSGYLSQSDLAQTFGLGAAAVCQRLLVKWPSGRQSELRDVPGGQIVIIRERD